MTEEIKKQMKNADRSATIYLFVSCFMPLLGGLLHNIGPSWLTAGSGLGWTTWLITALLAILGFGSICIYGDLKKKLKDHEDER